MKPNRPPSPFLPLTFSLSAHPKLAHNASGTRSVSGTMSSVIRDTIKDALAKMRSKKVTDRKNGTKELLEMLSDSRAVRLVDQLSDEEGGGEACSWGHVVQSAMMMLNSEILYAKEKDKPVKEEACRGLIRYDRNTRRGRRGQ